MREAFSKLELSKDEGKLEAALSGGGHLLVSAPTGSGKSLFVPYFLMERCEGKVVVLEPRRLAALGLARFFAECLGEEVGGTAGYKFRLESAVSARTRVVFQTYGSYLQELLNGGGEAAWVVFDEFHERKADMDLVFSCLASASRSWPRIAVLSATMDKELLEPALKTKCVEAGSKPHEVAILHQKPAAGATRNKEICRALRTLEMNGIWKTTLVFLPGKGEIQSAREAVEEAFGKRCPETLELYGGKALEDAKKIFKPSEAPRLIFTTNVAETSLTVPCVSGVVDSGYERTLEFSEGEGLGVLRLSRISLQNAVQRAGRAGRTSAGACVRLWSEEEERTFQKGIVPEVLKLDLKRFWLAFLRLSELHGSGNLKLLTAPKKERLAAAIQDLERARLLEGGKVTELGRLVLRSPIADVPRAACFLKLGSAAPETLALFAILDAGSEFLARDRKSHNLAELAHAFLENRRQFPKDVSHVFDRLESFASKRNFDRFKTIKKSLAELLREFPQNLAIRSGEAFTLPRKMALRAEAGNAKAILAFSLLKTGGQKSELHAAAYLEVPEELLKSETDTLEYSLVWRTGQHRFLGLCTRKNGATEISKTEIAPQEAAPETLKNLKGLTAAAWAQKIAKENLERLWLDDENRTLLRKMKLAAETFPDFRLPAWTEEDFALVLDEFTSGVFMESELTPERYRKIIREYFGEQMLPWLSQNFPDYKTLPNGRRARYAYPETGPVELSARLGDFMGSKGENFIAGGKLKTLYNILAPNYRTVQKTWDLSGFWERTYPEIRKELRGRYPKHPWPEKVG